jgi:GntR family transcriptional regulator, transcriptional repressor for pyruvate dehydrogenase complex
MELTDPARRRPLALDLVDALSAQIRDGRLLPGRKLPTEGQVMQAFGVSRTVVREALSKLQASGLVETRHGIGTFVVGAGEEPVFRIAPQQMETLRDVIAVLELRIGVETEAAGLAAQRRTAQNLAVMRSALDEFASAVEAGRDAVAADVRFHGEIARATQNEHFAGLLATMGSRIIPRARLEAAGTAGAATAAPTDGPAVGEGAQVTAAARPPAPLDEARRAYLRRVNTEHESIYDALQRQDAEGARAAMRTHLANSRERRRRAALGEVG